MPVNRTAISYSGSITTSLDYYNEWNKVYDKRTSILKTFVDKYGLKVGDKYKDDFNELIKNGANVAEKNAAKEAIEGLIKNAQFVKQDDGYGSFTYTATIQNTTNYTFTSVNILLALYDAQNVKAEETYAGTQSWKPGESVKFEAYSQTDAARVETSVDFYQVEGDE